MTAVAAVLLAAGAGSRFEGPQPKLLADLHGKPLLRWAIDAVVDAGLAGPYVVTGSVDLTEVLGDLPAVRNDRWVDGLATSLSAGIAAAARDGYEAVVVALGDQPNISPDSWRWVAEATQTPIAVATYEGQRAHPVRLGQEVWDQLPRDGDEGARAVMRARPELVTEVPCNSGNALDIDTSEDLVRFNSPTRSA